MDNIIQYTDTLTLHFEIWTHMEMRVVDEEFDGQYDGNILPLKKVKTNTSNSQCYILMPISNTSTGYRLSWRIIK